MSVGRPFRTAIDGNALPETIHALAWFGYRREIELQVVRDEEIEPAILVIVDERASRSPSGSRRGEPSGSRHILEPEFTAVAVEHIRAVRGHEQIEPAVVVHVARADRRRPGDAIESRTALVTSSNVPSCLLR